MDRQNPTLLFELGRLQVFHYPTDDEIKFKTVPRQVYWQDKESKNTYGPFASTHSAMTHYTWLAGSERVTTASHKIDDTNVIKVDFVARVRI